MNTKFKDIAEQAGFVLWGDESWNIGDNVDWGSRYDDELEKFAWLIVNECAGLVDHILKEGGGNQSDVIKQHFGICK